MIPNFLGGGGRKEELSPDAVAGRRQDLAAVAAESDRGVGGRTEMNLSPTAPTAAEAEARLIPSDLLAELRKYHRLRALVLAYLKVQTRREWLGRRLTNLQKAGPQPDIDFWEEFQAEFSGMGWRSDFSNLLLTGEDTPPQFVELVEEFDVRYTNVAEAAEAALNPNQSAQSATEALQHVSAMMKIGRTVAELCQEQTYDLLDTLWKTVTEIFAGDGASGPSPDREKDGRFSDKQVSGADAGPDVTAHQLSRSKGAP